MKILVAIKQVPERDAQVRIAVDGRSIDEDELPCLESHVPNAETIEALREGLRGDLKGFHTVEELMAELNS